MAQSDRKWSAREILTLSVLVVSWALAAGAVISMRMRAPHTEWLVRFIQSADTSVSPLDATLPGETADDATGTPPSGGASDPLAGPDEPSLVTPEEARRIRLPGAQDAAGETTADEAVAFDPSSVATAQRDAPARHKSGKSHRAGEKPSPAQAEPPRAIPDILNELQAVESTEWGPNSEKRLAALMNEWGKVDPQGALEYAMDYESRKTRSATTKAVLSTWLKTQPEAAIEWYQKNLAGDPLRVGAFTGSIFSELSQQNPANALAQAAALPTRTLRSSAMSAIISEQLSHDNLDGLLSMRDSMQPGADRDIFTKALLQNAGVYQPEMMADWARALPDTGERQGAIDSIISTWGSDQPAAAAEWLGALADEAERNKQASKLVQSWVKEDPVATADWLLSLNPPSPGLDPAVSSFVKTLIKDNPSGAMSWAGVVNDEKQRKSLMIQIGKSWLQSDPAGAQDYLNRTTLPESVVRGILGKSR